MSTIYYKEKKSIIDNNFLFSSDIVTCENIHKIFRTTYSGVGLSDISIPFPSISWRSTELYYDHADFGRVYIPKNIRFTDGEKNYHIVLIDTDIDVVFWPGSNLVTKDIDAKINHVKVTQEEFRQIENCFLGLMDYLGVNKSLEEQYKKVKGINLKRESIESFIETLFPEYNHLIDSLFAAALKPVLFFKDNRQYLEKLGIEEPSKEMYILILIYELENSNLVWTLDWKSSSEDINHAVSELSRGEITTVLDTVTADSVPKMLKKASAKLQGDGLILLKIYTDTDSYSIFLAENNKAQELIDLAKACKIKITLC